MTSKQNHRNSFSKEETSHRSLLWCATSCWREVW